MNSPRYARLAARLLAEAPEASVHVTETARAAAVERIAEALNEKTRRRSRRTKALGAFGAVAAAALGYFGVHAELRGNGAPSAQAVSAIVSATGSGAAISNQGTTEPLTNASALSQGGHLIAGASGGATVRLSTGTELSVNHDSDMEFENAGPVERFFLAQGVLRAKVAKLKPSERFIVRTPDAEVEVRGTTFRVEVVQPDADCAGGVRTRVVVTEGLVEVRGAGASTYVHPGETWPAGCRGAAATPVEAVWATPELRPAPSGPHAARSSSATSTRHSEPGAADESPEQKLAREGSSIAEQNELFSEAAAARRQGDNAAAAATFELLITRYPGSPLAEGATVQRMNLLAGSNPTAAKNAARQYLARYPRGYARSDAEKLLAQP